MVVDQVSDRNAKMKAGGQGADTGLLRLMDDKGDVIGTFDVQDIQTYGGFFLLHKGVVESGNFEVGAVVNCRVDYDRRRQIALNHSMTHVLNAALRQVLGENVDRREVYATTRSFDSISVTRKP
jgi:alanyl-tRNA synthetase